MEIKQAPVSLRHYQTGTDGARKVVRLLGLINIEEHENVLREFGFSIRTKHRDGSLDEREAIADGAQDALPTLNAYGMDSCRAMTFPRDYLYSVDPLVLDPEEIECVTVSAFAVLKDGERVTDEAQTIRFEDGVICTDMIAVETLAECVVNNPRYVKIPPYRAYGFDYLVPADEYSSHALCRNTDPEEYATYCKRLETEYGYTKYTGRKIANAEFATYFNDTAVLSVNYVGSCRETRIALNPKQDCVLHPLESDRGEAITTPMLTQINSVHSFIIRLSDGRFVVEDGGINMDENHEMLFQELNKQNVLGGKPVIAAWIFSHMHCDHVDTFVNFRRYADQIDLKKVVWNIPGFDVMTTYQQRMNETSSMRTRIERVKETLRTYFPSVEVIIPHAGQVMWFGEAKVEILYSHEDLFPVKMFQTNDSSTVYRIEIAGQHLILLGDLGRRGSGALCGIWEGESIKSDIVQIAHHGFGGGTLDLYAEIGADTALWTSSYETVSTNGLFWREVNRFDVFSVKENLIMNGAPEALYMPLPHKVGSLPEWIRIPKRDE